jgi:hypothetical protein
MSMGRIASSLFGVKYAAVVQPVLDIGGRDLDRQFRSASLYLNHVVAFLKAPFPRAKTALIRFCL